MDVALVSRKGAEQALKTCRLLLAMTLTADRISHFGRTGNRHRSRVEDATDLLATPTGDI
jgi:hypothetical protein